MAIENTHNTSGGRALSVDTIQPIAELCREKQLCLHMDGENCRIHQVSWSGARLANATVALDTSFEDLCRPVDSLSLCLSKGLGAPVGSIIASSEEMIYKVRESGHSC